METVISEVAHTTGIELKLDEEKASRGFIQGNYVFVSLPTGFGKNLIYGLLPETFDRIRNKGHSVALIVSPLIALITDQIASFSTVGISAIHFSESLHKEAKVGLQQGKFHFIWVELILFCRKYTEVTALYFFFKHTSHILPVHLTISKISWLICIQVVPMLQLRLRSRDGLCWKPMHLIISHKWRWPYYVDLVCDSYYTSSLHSIDYLRNLLVMSQIYKK